MVWARTKLLIWDYIFEPVKDLRVSYSGPHPEALYKKVKELMRKRSSEMPAEDVVVYCVSCIKSIYNGGKTPRYLVDLLFNESTLPKTFEPDDWHRELDSYIQAH